MPPYAKLGLSGFGLGPFSGMETQVLSSSTALNSEGIGLFQAHRQSLQCFSIHLMTDSRHDLNGLPSVSATCGDAGLVLSFEELEIGQKLCVSEWIDDSLHHRFTELSRDYSPLHTDPSQAQAFGYQERLGYGFLLTTLLSRMVGTYLQSAICVSVSVDFTIPVLVGDSVELQATVAQIQTATRSVVFRTEFRRGAELVARGKLITRFLER